MALAVEVSLFLRVFLKSGAFFRAGTKWPPTQDWSSGYEDGPSRDVKQAVGSRP